MGRGAPVSVDLSFVNSFRDRHGKERHYLRIPGRPAVALPGPRGSEAFMRAYLEARDQLMAEEPVIGPAPPYAMRTLAASYWQTTAFKSKKERTRYVERQQVERFLARHGDKDCRKVETRHLDAIFASMAETPAAAMDLRKKLRHLFRHAIKLGWRTTNPVDATDTFRLGTHHTWTDDEIATFHARWPRGSRQRTAFDLLLYSGQRSGDVRQMTWPDLRDGRIRVLEQGKTGESVTARIHSDLALTLDAHPRGHVVVIVTEFGHPFSEKGFGQFMAKAIAAAGLPERCVPHGLRKAAARRLAEAGCTPHEIMAITGHRTIKEVQRYTERVERARLADTGMKKTDPGTRTYKPSTNRQKSRLKSIS